jgi:hypothetical protein
MLIGMCEISHINIYQSLATIIHTVSIEPDLEFTGINGESIVTE